MKKVLLCLWALCLSTSVSASIVNGRYGAAQVFDSQRSPAYPTANLPFTVSDFDLPYSDVEDDQYTIASGGHIRFILVGGDINQNGQDGCNVGINYHPPGGAPVVQVAARGAIWGLSVEGFLYESEEGYGTFVSNNSGIAFGGSKTYTPTKGIASCADLTSYAASSTPLNVGETASSGNGQGNPLRESLGEEASTVDAILSHQAQAPIRYQAIIGQQIFTRMGEVRRLGAMQSGIQSNRAQIDLNLTDKYSVIEQQVENKVNQVYSDIVGSVLSSVKKKTAKKWNFWTEGTLAFGRVKETRDTEKVKLSSQGLTFGTDYFYSPQILIGAALSSGFSTSKIGINSEIDDTFFTLSGYSTWEVKDKLFLDFLLGLSYLKSESSRYIKSSDEMALGERDGLGINLATQVNYEYEYKDAHERLYRMIPFGRLDFIRNSSDGYTESGSSNNLAFSDQTIKRFSLNAGARFESVHQVSFGVLTPEVSAAYRRYLTSSTSGSVSSVNSPDLGVMQISLVGEDKDFFEVGTGLTLIFRQVHTVSGMYQYDQSFSHDSLTHKINLRYNYSF